MKSVLFVCTGNICRSPLAEALLRDYLEKQGAGGRFRVGSAGTFALNGNPATREGQRAARRWGLDLSGHRARQVTGSLLAETDFILGMTRNHCYELAAEFPEFENRIYLALLFPRRLERGSDDGVDVPDPIGLSERQYTQVLEMMAPALPRLYKGLLEKEEN
jgi:protein-tyrosine-phosphatase